MGDIRNIPKNWILAVGCRVDHPTGVTVASGDQATAFPAWKQGTRLGMQISSMIYKKIQRKLERISLDEYNSQVGVWVSFASKHVVVMLMKGIKKISPYVNSKDI